MDSTMIALMAVASVLVVMTLWAAMLHQRILDARAVMEENVKACARCAEKASDGDDEEKKRAMGYTLLVMTFAAAEVDRALSGKGGFEHDDADDDD